MRALKDTRDQPTMRSCFLGEGSSQSQLPVVSVSWQLWKKRFSGGSWQCQLSVGKGASAFDGRQISVKLRRSYLERQREADERR